MNDLKNNQDQFELLRKIQKKTQNPTKREFINELGFSLWKIKLLSEGLKKKVKLQNFQNQSDKISYYNTL